MVTAVKKGRRAANAVKAILGVDKGSAAKNGSKMDGAEWWAELVMIEC